MLTPDGGLGIFGQLVQDEHGNYVETAPRQYVYVSPPRSTAEVSSNAGTSPEACAGKAKGKGKKGAAGAAASSTDEISVSKGKSKGKGHGQKQKGQAGLPYKFL